MRLLSRTITLVLASLSLGCQLDLDKDEKSKDNKSKDKDKEIINSCGGSQPASLKYDITDMSLVVLNGEGIYKEGDPLPYDAMSISIRADTQSLVNTDTKKLEYRFSLFPSAHACSPVPPYTEENIKSLQISSSFNFNENTQAGESLNQYFDVVSAESSTPNYTYKEGKREYMNLTEYLSQVEVDAGREIVLKLNSEPHYFSDQTFYIDIHLDSGDKFQLQSSLILIKSD